MEVTHGKTLHSFVGFSIGNNQ